MKNGNDILSKNDRRSGMTVPEGYFDDFAAKMMQQISDLPDATAETAADKSFWFKIRPYVYMAAMFAGIWCMLNMFSIIGNSAPDLSVDNNPVVARALSNDQFVDEYYLYELDDNELLEDLYDSGISTDDISNFDPNESNLPN